MASDQLDEFRSRIGLGELPGLDAIDGVHVDWHDLPEAIASEVKGMRLHSSAIRLLEPGIAGAEWNWRRGERQISVSVFVSGGGPAGARDKLISLAAETTMVGSPFDLGPEHLGELAVSAGPSPFETIIWVFRNVCVEVDNDGTDMSAARIAQKVQGLMEKHLVHKLSVFVPKITDIEVSPKAIGLGDVVKVSVRMDSNLHTKTLLTKIRDTGDEILEPLDGEQLSATFKAVRVGRAQVDIKIVDPKTLLSPRVSVFIDVQPEQRRSP